jgi:hypothetical protein
VSLVRRNKAGYAGNGNKPSYCHDKAQAPTSLSLPPHSRKKKILSLPPHPSSPLSSGSRVAGRRHRWSPVKSPYHRDADGGAERDVAGKRCAVMGLSRGRRPVVACVSKCIFVPEGETKMHLDRCQLCLNPLKDKGVIAG